MSGVVRRAAGTMTAGDVLLRWVGVRRRSAEGDRGDLDAGQTLMVAAFSKSLGGQEMVSAGRGRKIPRLKSGYLHLAAGQPPVWVARAGVRDSAELVPPLALMGEGERVPAAPKFLRYTLTSSKGAFDVALPKKDVELVRYALSTVGIPTDR